MTAREKENQSWFFENINKISKSLAKFTKKKKETQITRFRNERGGVTTDLKRIMKENYRHKQKPRPTFNSDLLLNSTIHFKNTHFPQTFPKNKR